jgi:multiple antibiotic resistance protein
VNGAVQSFLLSLSALFSIVNPLGSALIFSQVTADRTHDERKDLARRIAFYSALIMLGALWGGAYVLNFFAVSLAALRIAGGFVVAFSAWSLLQRPEQNEERKQQQASQATGEDVAFSL